MTILPLKLVVIANTVSVDGNITFRIDDAAGNTVVAQTTQTFPTTISKDRLRETLREYLYQAEAENAPNDDVSTLTTDNRAVAKAIADITGANGVQWRALALILIDEINTLRQWEVSLKTAVANAGTLAALKTNVAALPNLADRTLAQLKGAYQAKIDGGNAD